MPLKVIHFHSFFLCLFLNSFFCFGQTLFADAGIDTTVCKGDEAVLLGNATGGGEPYSYSWTPSALLTNSGIANPTTSLLLQTTTFYLVVKDNLENVSLDSVTVYVDPLPSCYEPGYYNTFTPNKDGINDTWIIRNIENYPANTLEIYNRTGKLVYKAAPYTNSWAGTAFGDDLPAATYYYIFDPGSGLEIKRGSVTIIK